MALIGKGKPLGLEGNGQGSCGVIRDFACGANEGTRGDGSRYEAIEGRHCIHKSAFRQKGLGFIF